MGKYDEIAHYQDFNELLSILDKSNNNYDLRKIQKAYNIAEKAHGDQRRVSGIPFILHPTSVACIVAQFGMDSDSIISALLHDVVEDTDYDLNFVRKEFGKDVANIVDGVTKISKIKLYSREEQQAENVRKMLIAMSNDIRVIIVKLADRLHNMRTIECMKEQKRRDKSRECMEVYAPIAHRLGMKAVKDELEDLSLRYLDPVGYKEIEDALLLKENERDRFIEKRKKEILKASKMPKDKITVYGRVKSINSIYRKTFLKGKTLEEIYDFFALRIIVDDIKDCYNLLGVIHDLYTPIPRRFKDYISTPKPNMYQSLHTTVIDREGIPFEVQIRTWEMHQTAENGIAAHWKYKLGFTRIVNNKKARELDANINRIKDVLAAQIDTDDSTDIIRNIRNDFDQNEVYVFSPKGDVFNLPNGSTVIDLAYLIHTEVGNHMVGAKVNQRIVPIDYKLKTGEICEILTQKDSHPRRDWLEICKTSSARSKIRQWFKREKRDENIVEGKMMLERELKRSNISLTDEELEDLLQFMLKKNKFNTVEDLYASVGYGGIQLWKVLPRIKEEYHTKFSEQEKTPVINQNVHKPKRSNSGVIVEGMEDCLIKFSQCCNPLPGDDIIGYITRGFGVSIHKRGCSNIPEDISKAEEPERYVNVRWENDINDSFHSTLEIICSDRTGVLADVTIALSSMRIFINNLNSRPIGNGRAMVTATIDVFNREHLETVIKRLQSLREVISIKRF
ncbi:MAG: bifunctional (p)ppGpp synthetase/guanosine-3',5'-bis(diphosphate) 3'-pyrophosphohydrolase [Ruminococcus sp.]|nr:bifunctional (p)ppGpp synthetase/guanosine-3',5'-bis(diphosphate) 3'-pyrophosphohydrolase [Ruminococcus sp.]